jgi:lipopolysaccharide export system protein LptA
MRARLLAAAALAALGAATPLPAQDNVCHLRQNRQVTSVGEEPNRVGYVSGPLLVTCDRGEELRSDSAVVYQGTHEVQLFGRVDYQDPTRALTSDFATYNSQTGRLFAQGNVVFTDKERGSTLRGPQLEYFRQMEGRPDAQMIAPNRPHLTLVPRQQPGQARRDPMEVDGDRITTVGNRYMSSEGNVVIHGKDLNAHSTEAFYDADQDRLELRRNANVVGQKYTLTGDFIETQMKEGKVQRVLARTDARLVSDKLTVNGPQLTLFFADDQLQRLVSAPQPGTPRPAPAPTSAPASATVAAGANPPNASGAQPAAGRTANAADTARARQAAQAAPAAAVPAVPRSVATATGFKLEADSLDALMPNQQLRTVTAVGRAHGESWDTAKVDSSRLRRPAPAARPRPAPAARDTAAARRAAADSAATAAALAEVPQDRDVVDADTIVGHFIQVDTSHARPARPPRTPADTTKPEPKTELDRMQAFGSAHALYRLKPKRDTTAARDTAAVDRPGINYVIGDTIDLKLASGEVQTAHVLGLERGIYLDPSKPASDTTAAGTVPGATGAASGGASRSGRQPGRPSSPTSTPAAPAAGVPSRRGTPPARTPPPGGPR